MTKLTTEITIEELQYRIHAHENDLTQMWTADYFLSVQKELLALKQAAKNPVAWVATDSEGFPEYNGHNEFSADCGAGTPLYAAPVLPKQPELIGIKVSIDTGSDNIGHRLFGEIVGTSDSNGVPVLCIEVTENNDVEPAPAQPVSNPYKLPDGWVMVPQQIFLDASDIESICSQCGDGHKSGYGDFTDGLLWVGDIQCDNGTIMHGLHISSSDYQEEGGLTLAEFKAPVQEPK